MTDAQQLVTELFKNKKIDVPANRKQLFSKFLVAEENKAAADIIIHKLNELMASWTTENRIADILQQPLRIMNATIGKGYEASFDLKKLKLDDVTAFEFRGLQEAGLYYDEKTKQITGLPTVSGDIPIKFCFKIDGQSAGTPFNEKTITLAINPDPRSLWKDLESDRNDPYWKEDNRTEFSSIGNRHILVSSKRGRSHANNGSFREDDFGFKDLENGWSIVALSDGAGSAKMSRKGSAIACKSIVEYFTRKEPIDSLSELDDLVAQHKNATGDDTSKKLNYFVYNNLGKAVFYVHKELETFAREQSITLKDLSATFIFTLIKRYDAGYAFLSFGVGDCPIALLNKEITEVTLMNWIDVGEFGGGTRFITMPEIFQNQKFATRFGFKLVDDFSYLFMMSDGIYDPKFVVEANLPNIKIWQAFLADLNGQNEEGQAVDLKANNENIITQFSAWMDFWSKGNHDDRTLAIVF